MTPHASSLTVVDTSRQFDELESRLTAPVSERMLDLAGVRAGMRILDLASGRGEPSLRAARRVGPTGFVLAVDISAPVLAVAREKALHAGISNLEVRLADAESLAGISDESFDAATARWGLMGMRSPVSALASARRVLKRGAPFVAAFWAEPERVAWRTLSRQVLANHCTLPALDPDAPGAFRYADPSRIARDFAAAGFAMEHVEEMDIPVVEAKDAADIVAWVCELGLDPLATTLPPDKRSAWESELAHAAERYRVGDAIRLGGITRLVVGRSTRS